MKNQKSISVLIFILILIIIIFYIPSLNETQINEINSFEECAAAGFPVMESYPRQCRDAEGNLFVEQVRRSYVGYSAEECLTISILCTPDREYFSDETGCGCELKEDVLVERVNCTDESRNADACIEIYQPVCGWFNPEKVKCVNYPCAITFSNSCFACMDGNIAYYTGGECPE